MINNDAGATPTVLETCVAGRHDRCIAWEDCGCGCHQEDRAAVAAGEVCAEGHAGGCRRPECTCSCHVVAADLARWMWLFRRTGFVLWAVCGALAGSVLSKLPGSTWSVETFAALAQTAMLCLLAGWAGWLIAGIDPGDEATWDAALPPMFLVWPVMALVWLARMVAAGAGRRLWKREEVRTDGGV